MTPHPDLIVSCEGAEDAGVMRISKDLALVFTTDFFPPIVDDPFEFGQIAAANSLSDVYAMGGRPLAALNLCGFPKELDVAILAEILAGGAAKVREAGAVIAGGHTVKDSEIKYGLAVTGTIHPERVLRNHGLRPGDVLVLTKPLGTGLITSSIKGRANDGPEVREAVRWMTMLNAVGIESVLAAAPHALTDVTGFGFLGHLSEMVAGDAVQVTVSCRAVPRIPGVEKCFEKGCRTKALATNLAYAGPLLDWEPGLGEWDRDLLLDPQTSGGLLAAVPADRAPGLVRELRAAGLVLAAEVGSVERSDRPRIRVVA